MDQHIAVNSDAWWVLLLDKVGKEVHMMLILKLNKYLVKLDYCLDLNFVLLNAI